MIAGLLPIVPLVPSGVPLLLAIVAMLIYRLLRSRRRLRVFGWIVFLALLGASIPLWPIPGVPRQTINWLWSLAPGAELRLGIDLGSATDLDKGALSLLLLLMGAFGCWSICWFPVTSEQARQRAAGLPGLLLVLAGSQFAVQSVAPFGGVIGVAIVIAGSILLDLLASNRHSLLREAGRAILLLAPVAVLGVAVWSDPTLAATFDWWAIGCAGLLIVSLIYGATSRSPLMAAGTAQALGVPLLAVWLLLWTNTSAPAHAMLAGAAIPVGSLLFVLGAINVAVASSLRGLFYAQWIAGLGLLCLSFGMVDFTPALAHLVVASLMLSLVLGWLAEVSATESITGLPAFPEPLRHQALAYALAAASVSGLPLTLGYTLRRAIASQVDATFIGPLLLAGSTLLICGLLQPLAALVRRSAEVIPIPSVEEGFKPPAALYLVTNPPPDANEVMDSPPRAGEEMELPEPVTGSWYSGMLLGVLLTCIAAYPALQATGAALVRRPVGEALTLLVAAREVLIIAGLRVGVVLLMLGFAGRALRRLAEHPPFSPMPSAQSGWALPLAGLAEVIAPLTPGFWTGLGRSHPRRAVVLVGVGLAAGLVMMWWGVAWRP
jgi:hypothetical protein